MARARVAPAPATLVVLLTVAMAATATGAGADNSNICDTVNCGKGNCSEVPGIIPILTSSYNCTCDPGWSQPKLLNLTVLPFAPCIIPNCSFSSACFNITALPAPPRGIPLTDPCAAVSCGEGGDCEKGVGFSYQCRCQPGFYNLLNMTSMPCIGGNCTFGADCAKLGLVNTLAAVPIRNPSEINDFH